MTQNKTIWLFLLVILFISCAQKIPLNETVQRNDKIYYNSKPFTGIAYSSYSDGNPYIEEEYNNGINNGEKKIWYINGKQKLKETYLNGKLHGDKIEWYENGNMKTKTNYEDGEEKGLYIEWFENGKKKLEVDKKAHHTFYNN